MSFDGRNGGAGPIRALNKEPAGENSLRRKIYGWNLVSRKFQKRIRAILFRLARLFVSSATVAEQKKIVQELFKKKKKDHSFRFKENFLYSNEFSSF